MTILSNGININLLAIASPALVSNVILSFNIIVLQKIQTEIQIHM